MDIVSKEFAYATGVVSRKAYDDHLTLYNGYIKKTNEITQELSTNPDWANSNATYSHYRGLKKGETYAINGVILHELYFQNLGNEAGPIGLQNIMNRSHGSTEKWKEDFIACANAARGWCIFVYEQRTGTYRNIVLDSHEDGNIATAYPIIVLDMYEHAYFTDYGTDKSAYINRFISNIPWGIIEKRAKIVGH